MNIPRSITPLQYGMIFILFTYSAPQLAEDRFVLRGFGTLGIARSTTKDAEFVRDLSQPGGIHDQWSHKIDSLLGLQANWQITPELESVAQIVSRYHSDASFQPELMWGFLKFDPDAATRFRLGRLGSEFYMLADSRLVGYSYSTVRPSNDFFGGLPFSYVDGADALLTLPTSDGVLRTKVMAGWARENIPSGDLQFKLNHSLLSGGYFDYQTTLWQWRLSYFQLRLHDESPALPLLNALESTPFPQAHSVATDLSTIDKTVKYFSLGLVYDDGPLQSQLLLSKTCFDTSFFENNRAGSFLVSYQLGAFRPFFGFSWIKSTPKYIDTGLPPMPPLSDLDNAIHMVMRDSHADQHTFTLGGRWDFLDNMALKFQWDGIRGKPNSIWPYRWEIPSWSGHTNIFSLALDFVF